MNVLRINGVEKQFPAGLPETLTELLKQLNIEAQTVVAEIDGQIIKSEDFDKKELCSGQNIELVRFVPGG